MAGLLDFLQSASNSAASNVSAPVDGIAWLLRKAGLDVGEPVGGSDWMQRQGLTRPVKQGAASLAGETAGLLSPMLAAAKAPQIARGLLSLDDHAMDMARKGIEGRMVSGGLLQPATVWHGSPHKFDKFDSSKIGTGEGAQAYGHGLYLAENPGVAKTYTTAGTDAATKQSHQFTDPLQRAAATVEKAGGDVAFAIRRLTFDAERGDTVAANAIKALKSGAKLPDLGLSNLYKVDLPDDQIAKMLDWDKPLSQQAPEVQAALGDLALKNQAHIGGVPIRQFIYDKTQQTGSLPSVVIGEIEKAGSLDAAIPVLQRKFSGANDAAKRKLDELLSALRQQQISMQTGVDSVRTGGDIVRGGYNPPEIAQALNGRGIPGIRYLDGGSRGAGQGSSNFVVFPGNEGLLSILERNGAPIGK